MESLSEKIEGGDGNYDELLLEKKAFRERSTNKKTLSKTYLVEQLKETDVIIETCSNVSTLFQTSYEIISVNENEYKTVLKLQTNLDALDSSDSEVSSTLDDKCPSKNMEEGFQKRKRQSSESLTSSSSSKASSSVGKPKAKKFLKIKISD